MTRFASSFRSLAGLLRRGSGRSHATLPVPTREDGEFCVTSALAAAKETKIFLVFSLLTGALLK